MFIQRILILLILTLTAPSIVGNQGLRNILKPISISVNKFSPPFYAFSEIISENVRQNIHVEEATLLASASEVQNFIENTKVDNDLKNEVINQSEYEGLTYEQKVRLEKANISENQLSSTWTDTDEVRLKEIIGRVNKQEDEKQIAQASAIKVYKGNSTQVAQAPQARIEYKQDEQKHFGEYTINGPIEVNAGSYTPSNSFLELRRWESGRPLEQGVIDVKSGDYKIKVNTLSGILKARLLTKEGVVLGEGSLRLASISAKSNKITGSKIAVVPRNDHVTAKATGYDSKKKVIAQLSSSLGDSEESDSNGVRTIQNIQEGSSVIVRADSDNYMSGMSLLIAGEEKNITLIEKKAIKNLKEIISEKENISYINQTGSIVWGVVKNGEKTISGAQVEVENQENSRIIYFNEFLIPDFSLNSTSGSGVFVILDLPEGLHSILATTESGTYLSHSNVPVEDNSISFTDLKLSSMVETVEISLFDAFTGEPQKGALSLQGSGFPIDIDGYARTLLQPINRYSLYHIEVDPEYFSHIGVYNDVDSEIDIPLVRKNWVNSIKSEMRVNDLTSNGIIVGFVHGGDFEAYLVGVENYALSNIVYFDHMGNINNEKIGKAGGGFIMFNVPHRTHSVVVMPKESEKIISKIVPVDNDQGIVLSFEVQ